MPVNGRSWGFNVSENPETGAISPDRGNHAIRVTRAGRERSGIPRRVRYLVHCLACAWRRWQPAWWTCSCSAGCPAGTSQPGWVGRSWLPSACYEHGDNARASSADMAASPGRPTCRPSRTRMAVLLWRYANTHGWTSHVQPQRWVHMMASGKRHESYGRRK